jgi:hypothetical protein
MARPGTPMTNDNAYLTRLLDDVDTARAEAYRLFRDAMENPGDSATVQRMWEAVQRQEAAMRAALRFTSPDRKEKPRLNERG